MKKKFVKRVLSTLLVVVMMLTAVPLNGFVGLEILGFLNNLFATTASAGYNSFDNTLRVAVKDANGNNVTGATVTIYKGDSAELTATSNNGIAVFSDFDINEYNYATILAQKEIKGSRSNEKVSLVSSTESMNKKLLSDVLANDTIVLEYPQININLDAYYVGRDRQTASSLLKKARRDFLYLTNGVVLLNFSMEDDPVFVIQHNLNKDIIIYDNYNSVSTATANGYNSIGCIKTGIRTTNGLTSSLEVCHELSHYIFGMKDEYCFEMGSMFDRYNYNLNGNQSSKDLVMIYWVESPEYVIKGSTPINWLTIDNYAFSSTLKARDFDNYAYGDFNRNGVLDGRFYAISSDKYDHNETISEYDDNGDEIIRTIRWSKLAKEENARYFYGCNSTDFGFVKKPINGSFGVMESDYSSGSDFSTSETYSYLTNSDISNNRFWKLTDQYATNKESCVDTMNKFIKSRLTRTSYTMPSGNLLFSQSIVCDTQSDDCVVIRDSHEQPIKDSEFMMKRKSSDTLLADVSFAHEENDVILNISTNKNIKVFSIDYSDSVVEEYTPSFSDGFASVRIPFDINKSYEYCIALKDQDGIYEYNSYIQEQMSDDTTLGVLAPLSLVFGRFDNNDAVKNISIVTNESKEFFNGEYKSIYGSYDVFQEDKSIQFNGILLKSIDKENRIDFTSIKVFLYSNGIYKEVPSNISWYYEGSNISVSWDYSGEGTYIIMAKSVSNQKIKNVTDISVSNVDEYDGWCKINFNDSNTESELESYNVYYSDNQFDKNDLESILCKNFSSNEDDFEIEFGNNFGIKYFAVQALGKNGSVSDLSDVVSYDLQPKDSDKDGIPDFWLEKYSQIKDIPNVANHDSDGDGYTNLQEYLNGTDPLCPDMVGGNDPDVIDVVVSEELFDGFSKELIDKVANAMFGLKSSVDIDSYGISTKDAVALFSAISKYYPSEYSLLANDSFNYRIICSPNRDVISKIRFYYGDGVNLSNYQRRVNELNNEIDSLVAKLDGMNDFEKALYVHDYIVLNSEYDLELLEILESTTGSLDGELRSERYTEYSILVNGTGVCGSYALAYRAVLNAAGMECLYLSSREMNHAWNLVKINGNWYHVDCCWDDPVPDTYGRARRTYFLRTDKEIMDLKHYSWTPGKYKAADSTYSNMLRNSDVTQKYNGSNGWIYLDSGNICESDLIGNSKQTICSVSASSVDFDGGNVYYAKGRSIYKYNAEKDKGTLAYTMSSSEAGAELSKASIKNFYVNGNEAEIYKFVVINSETKTVKSNVIFNSDYESITGIEINKTKLSLDVFKSETLTAKIISNGSTNGMFVTWTSSNPSVATVDDNGKVTGKNIGTAVITASFEDFTASCTVTVTGNGLEGYCGSNVTWYFDVDSGLMTISGNGKMNSYSSSSNRPWHSLRQQIKSIDIGFGVTNIGRYAFYQCTSLSSIIIPDSVMSIEEYAFEGCIGLTSITIPNSVASIGNASFYSCTGLKSIMVLPNNPNYSSDSYGVLFNKDKTELIQYPTGNEREFYEIPNSVTSIMVGAFYCCIGLTHITIPNSVTSIGMGAFYFCAGLISVKIPNSVTSIEASTFFGCTGLTSITIPDSVSSIANSAFYYCIGLTSITIPDSVTIIGGYAFHDCSSLKNLTIPASVSIIGENIFLGCTGLTNISVSPNNTKYSSDSYGALYNKDKTNLIQYPIGNERESFAIPDNVSNIDSYAFYSSENLKRILITNKSYDFDLSDFRYIKSDCSVYLHRGLDKPDVEYYEDYYDYCITIYNIDVIEHTEHIYFISDEVQPTDTEDGYRESVCYCGEKRREVLHNMVESETVEPTCTTDGSRGLACTNCDYNELETLPATGHNYVVTKSEGDCSTETTTTYTCSACGDSYTETGDCDESKHDYTTQVVAPTCTEVGYSIDICNNCQEKVLYDYKSPTGHKMTIKRTEATCKDHAIVEYTCSVCGYKETVQDTATDLAEHTITTITVDPTCDKPGEIKEFCTVCNEVFSTEAIPALGHSYGEWSVTTAPTCTDEGVETHTCTRCDHSETRAITATDHSIVTDKAIPATCTETGLTEGSHCSVCNAIITAQEIVQPLGHTYGDWTVTATPNCTADGAKSHTCTVCNYSEIDAISALDHTVVVDKESPATCTETGHTEGSHCSVCDAIITAQEIIPATGHIFGAWTIVTPATAEKDGLEERTCHCGEKETRSIPKIKSEVVSVKLNNKNVDTNYNRSFNLTPSIDTIGNPQYKVEYSSSNPKVATVDKDGNVKTTGRGDATITVTVTDSLGNVVKDTCTVKVTFTFLQWLLYIICFGWIWM